MDNCAPPESSPSCSCGNNCASGCGGNSTTIITGDQVVNGSGEANTASSSGTANAVFKNKVGVDLVFKTLRGDNSLEVDGEADEVSFQLVGDVDAPGNNYYYGTNAAGEKGFFELPEPDDGDVGEANTASNLGAGVGVYRQKSGVDLQFRSLVAANSSIVLSPTANDINFALVNDNQTPGSTRYYGTDAGGIKGFFPLPTGVGETNTASNVGTGAQIFKTKVGVDFHFRTLIGSGGNLISTAADELTITAPSIQAAGIGTALYIGLSGAVHQFRNLVGGTNVTLSVSGQDITISVANPTWANISSKPTPEKIGFVVGVGQPMVAGQSILTDARFVGCDVDVYRNTAFQNHFDAGDGGTYYTKATLAANSITIIPAVTAGETIVVRIVRV